MLTGKIEVKEYQQENFLFWENKQAPKTEAGRYRAECKQCCKRGCHCKAAMEFILRR
jgi:hypothetical protein